VLRIITSLAVVFSICLPVIAEGLADEPLSCKPADLQLGESQVQTNTCLIRSVDEMADGNALLVQLSSNNWGAKTHVPSAQVMSENQFWHSGFLKNNPSLIIATNPLFHFQPNLCRKLERNGYSKTKVLAFGVSAYNSLQPTSATQSRPEGPSRSITPTDFIETYPYIPYVLAVKTPRASRLLAELNMQHVLLGEGDAFEESIFSAVALANDRPVLLVDEYGLDKTAAWVANLDINHLFWLRGGAVSLLRMKGDLQRINMSRTGVSRRVTCAAG